MHTYIHTYVARVRACALAMGRLKPLDAVVARGGIRALAPSVGGTI